MCVQQWITSVSLAALGAFLACEPALAQQFQGSPGAPGTLEFPDSRVLPIPTPPFNGVINPNLIDSKPSWPSTIAPQGLPSAVRVHRQARQDHDRLWRVERIAGGYQADDGATRAKA